jgi:hypothetical protein
MASLARGLCARSVAAARTVLSATTSKSLSGAAMRHTCGTCRQDGETKPALSSALVLCSGSLNRKKFGPAGRPTSIEPWARTAAYTAPKPNARSGTRPWGGERPTTATARAWPTHYTGPAAPRSSEEATISKRRTSGRALSPMPCWVRAWVSRSASPACAGSGPWRRAGTPLTPPPTRAGAALSASDVA